MIFIFCQVSTSWSVELLEKKPVASISLGAEFSIGSYNSASTTRSLYMPLIASWFPTERLDVSVELPFIYQNNSHVTTSLYHNSAAIYNPKTVARRGGPGGIMSTGNATSTGSGAMSYGSSGSSSAVSGLGDIILRAGYIPFLEKDAMPQVRTSLFVKTPTASVSEGLGTGEFDFGGGFDLSKWFGDLHLAGEVIYNYQGRVSGFGLNNYLSYTSAVGYQLTKHIQPMLVLKGATAPSNYSDDLLEARARVIWSLTDKTSLDMYGSRGISDSSPDYGGGISVIYSF
jgi:hypothetical protein